MPATNHHLNIFGRAHNPKATYQGKKVIDTLDPEKIFEVFVPYIGLVAILVMCLEPFVCTCSFPTP